MTLPQHQSPFPPDREPLLAGSGLKPKEPFVGQGLPNSAGARGGQHARSAADDGLEVVSCPECGTMTPIDTGSCKVLIEIDDE
jgi:hypothetical protein